MSVGVQRVEPERIARTYPFRRTFVIAEALIAVNAVIGTIMLLTNTFAPDVSVLRPLGLHSWTLPGLWLFASVAAPSAWAGWAAARRHDRAPEAVVLASVLLLVELLVQVPFLGFDPLQPVMGVPALVLAALALRARRNGWRSGSNRSTTASTANPNAAPPATSSGRCAPT